MFLALLLYQNEQNVAVSTLQQCQQLLSFYFNKNNMLKY